MASPLSTSASSLTVQELVPMRSHVCLPGDAVLCVGAEATVAVGGGLRPLAMADGQAGLQGEEQQQPVYLLAEVCAPAEKVPVLGSARMSRYTLESPGAHRYDYAVGDPVVAIVARSVSRHLYYCYTGGPALASLDALAFDGATKSSRPRLLEGDVLYARVKSTGTAPVHSNEADNECAESGAASGEPELSCTAAEVGLAPKDWTSGESTFGPLAGGRVLTVPLPYARSLLTPCDASAVVAAGPQSAVPASYLLVLLGARVPFDVCVGVNGMVWVRGQASERDATAEVRRSVAICACLTEAQYDVTREEMEARVASYFPE